MNVVGVLTSPWAITQDRLEELTQVYSNHLKGLSTDLDGLEAKLGRPLARVEQGYDVIGGVAVIPIFGVIAKRMNLFTQISGGVSTELIGRDFEAALADAEVHSIMLHADTPGGTVDGTAELAKTIFEARGKKPVYTLVDGLMASAGVWIGSAANKVFATSETALVGSIGVVVQHVDYSERNKKLGLTVTDVYAGKYKRIAGDNKPLSEEGQAHLQERVDYIYSIFVDAVAAHRGVTTSAVLERMADGKIFVGKQAVNAGLIDGFSSLGDLVSMLNGDDAGSSSQALANDKPPTLRQQWERDPDLRAEFAGDFDIFQAYKNRHEIREQAMR